MLEEQKKMIKSSLVSGEASESVFLYKNYLDILCLLERSSTSIHSVNMLIRQLESELFRLKSEVMAAENEYKNLRRLIVESFSS